MKTKAPDPTTAREIQKWSRIVLAGNLSMTVILGIVTLVLIACAVCIVVGFAVYAMDVYYRAIRTP